MIFLHKLHYKAVVAKRERGTIATIPGVYITESRT